jgi:hypothetical protein
MDLFMLKKILGAFKTASASSATPPSSESMNVEERLAYLADNKSNQYAKQPFLLDVNQALSDSISAAIQHDIRQNIPNSMKEQIRQRLLNELKNGDRIVSLITTEEPISDIPIVSGFELTFIFMLRNHLKNNPPREPDCLFLVGEHPTQARDYSSYLAGVKRQVLYYQQQHRTYPKKIVLITPYSAVAAHQQPALVDQVTQQLVPEAENQIQVVGYEDTHFSSHLEGFQMPYLPRLAPFLRHKIHRIYLEIQGHPQTEQSPIKKEDLFKYIYKKPSHIKQPLSSTHIELASLFNTITNDLKIRISDQKKDRIIQQLIQELSSGDRIVSLITTERDPALSPISAFELEVIFTLRTFLINNPPKEVGLFYLVGEHPLMPQEYAIYLNGVKEQITLYHNRTQYHPKKIVLLTPMSNCAIHQQASLVQTLTQELTNVLGPWAPKIDGFINEMDFHALPNQYRFQEASGSDEHIRSLEERIIGLCKK